MSNQVDRTGTYRFTKVLEAGVGAKQDEKGNFKTVSFNVRLLLSEYYDEQEGEWVDWSSAEIELPAYLYLFGVDRKSGKLGPTFHHEAVMKVFNWDGKSFQILANDDYSKIKGQVRIKDNDPEYADRNPFQVSNIDVYDADPSNQLRSLDPTALKELDAKFAQVLQASGQAPKPATLPAKKSTKPKLPAQPAVVKPEPEPEPEQGPPTKEEKKAILKAKSDKLRNKGKTTGPQPPTRKPEPPISTVSENSGGNNRMTKNDAWGFVVEMKKDDCDDAQLNASWGSAINQIAGEATSDEDITEEQWSQIAHQVIDKVGKF